MLCSSSDPLCLQAAWTLPASLLPAAWPTTGTIQFEDYGLQYRKGLDWALKGISISIQDKEKVSTDHSLTTTELLITHQLLVLTCRSLLVWMVKL